MEFDHGQAGTDTAPHDHPREDGGGIRVGEDNHDHGVVDLNAVGHDNGHRLRPERQIQVAEQVDREVDRRSEMVGPVFEVGNRPDGHAGFGQTGLKRVLYHPAVSDHDDAGH